jgi:trk system potassium uptake protein TrkH
MSNSRLAHFSAGRVILFALFCTIMLGTLLLALPISRHAPMAFIDLLFTATSVTCVTGIFTVPLDQFTFFGHCVLLFLMQIGGLGIITLTLFLLSSFMHLGLASQLMAGKLLELESWKNIRELLEFIILLTVSIELIGAASFFLVFYQEYPAGHAVFLSVFHAVSFFCNAGITLFASGISVYANNYQVIGTAALLMLIGGLGFVTIYELIMRTIGEKKHLHFSLQSKIVLYGAFIGICITTLLIWLLERHHAFASMSTFGSIINSIFHAISFRSTGLLSVSVGSLHLATLFLVLVVSFIGSAPGSTGSGVRTTAMAIYLSVVRAAIEGQTIINIGSRRIAKDQVNKAIAIISLSIFWIALTTFSLLIIEPRWQFIDVLFETVCAFTNLGLTTGITPHLSSLGKFLIMLSMIIGRIGSLTLILALRKIALRAENKADIVYPEERVMLS